ncbi:protein shisa-6 isoform X2 [Alosa alosa]|uniref:protein shisa-6 isoform X2 n=1 Tax=Alosa alosa TaxID=278164 RepID=UPI00201503FD|nr:protein shisa-6 isoform X2 [Alosa alosa]
MKQAMGIQHFLLLLIYLDPLNVFCAVPKRTKAVPKKKPKEVNSTAAPTASIQRIAQVQLPTVVDFDSCRGYYDVSGAYDKEFACNHTDHHYCCGTCALRFCCQFKYKRLDQSACKNYQKPKWDQTSTPAPAPTEDTYDPSMDQTNTAVYITCGVIAFIIVLGVSVKVAYDKANQPPQEMNIHRALADILRQQGPIPISQYDCENFAAMNSSPKDNTPARTGSKNHYTPVHTSKSNHSGHYGKESSRSGGHDLHNFISSGFVTLGRGHVKGEKHWPVRSQSHHGAHQHNYNHVGLSSPTRTPKNESSRMNNILTSQTEPYDLSFSRSFQSLSHLPPSYESAMKADLNRFSSLKKLSDKDTDEYYSRKRHLADLAIRGTLPLHVIRNKEAQGSQPALTQQQQQHQQAAAAAQQQQQQQGAPSQRQRPRRVQRAMSQDRVLSPERGHAGHDYAAAAMAATVSSTSRGMSSAYGPMSPYGGRILSDEQLLSAERLRSHERLLSQERLYSHERHYSHERLHSSDRLYSHDRLYSQDRLLSQDPLLSPDKMMSIKRSAAAAAAMPGFRSDKSMSRAISHTDVHLPSTPLMDRYKMTKMHSHPSASNNASQQPPPQQQQQQQQQQQHNTLNRNQTASKRQAFASRRTQTVEQFQYIPNQQQQQHHHHYRTGSKTEVTV